MTQISRTNSIDLIPDERYKMEYLDFKKIYTTNEMFEMYKATVLNKAAYSIGCDHSDLDDTAIIEFWDQGFSTEKAACWLENALCDNYPWVGDVQ